MQIGIHSTKGSFSDRWIAYCENQHISYKIVDCYKSNIIQQLADCDALMWHFNHAGSKDVLFAKQLLYSVKASGKQVFPDFETVWHFDDKVGQKYLLEAIGAPLVPSYVFYTKEEALDWVNQTDFPKVFKLRGGAGSANVRLAITKSDAIKLIRRAFGRGFSQYEGWSNLSERFRKYKNGKTSLFDVFKGVIRLFHTTDFAKVHGREKGYIYFQDFIDGNDSDIRVIVIDGKAFAIKRLVRKNDFRASGSGHILYEKELFDEATLKLSFEMAEKISTQCIAFDFVYDFDKPKIVEISYGFSTAGYEDCPGYWDKSLNWHEGKFDPYGWMVKTLI